MRRRFRKPLLRGVSSGPLRGPLCGGTLRRHSLEALRRGAPAEALCRGTLQRHSPVSLSCDVCALRRGPPAEDRWRRNSPQSRGGSSYKCRKSDILRVLGRWLSFTFKKKSQPRTGHTRETTLYYIEEVDIRTSHTIASSPADAHLHKPGQTSDQDSVVLESDTSTRSGTADVRAASRSPAAL